MAAFSPDFIAVEPQSSSEGTCVTTADPAIVSRTVEMVRAVDPKVKVLCSAGVKNGKDVQACPGP